MAGAMSLLNDQLGCTDTKLGRHSWRGKRLSRSPARQVLVPAFVGNGPVRQCGRGLGYLKGDLEG
jgi:hypothetical protein